MSGGRWPANVILSPAMAEALDRQSGILKSPRTYTRSSTAQGEWLHRKEAGTEQVGFGDEGGASRFFLQAGYEQWELDWILANGLRLCGTEDEA